MLSSRQYVPQLDNAGESRSSLWRISTICCCFHCIQMLRCITKNNVEIVETGVDVCTIRSQKSAELSLQIPPQRIVQRPEIYAAQYAQVSICEQRFETDFLAFAAALSCPDCATYLLF